MKLHGRYRGKHIAKKVKKRGEWRLNRALILCAVFVLVLSSSVGGTLAYLRENTGFVSNDFKSGNIRYTLNLMANAANADSRYQDTDVTMPAKLIPTTGTSLSVIFTADGTPALTGYTFDGWYYDADCTEKYANYEDNRITVNYSDTHDKDTAPNQVEITLYAGWKANKYTVSFDSYPSSKTVTYDSSYGELPLPKRGGYDFLGWTLEKTGTDYITASTIVKQTKNHTLYAQWSAKTYVIRFHANGGTGTMPDQTIVYAQPTALSKNIFTREDHTFVGWSTTADADTETYIDEQTVVSLLTEGSLDLYAVWAQNTHTVTFDYTGGKGSTTSKAVQNGKAYGILPTYPTRDGYLFLGWYTESEGGTRVYPDTLVNRTDNHTLYAHWRKSSSNAAVMKPVVKNNPDDNQDGIVDDIYLNFACSAYCEKFNVPIENLQEGATYKLSYTASNNAIYGSYYWDYKDSIYGSIITVDENLTTLGIKAECIQAGGLLAEWTDRFDSALLNGPHSREMIFTAEAETMYWTWDFGLIQDGDIYDYSITDIKLEKISDTSISRQVPDIQFNNIKFVTHNGATLSSSAVTNYGLNYDFTGKQGNEIFYYPITGLVPGVTYTLTFDHSFSGKLYYTWDYCCVFTDSVPVTQSSSDWSCISSRYNFQNATNNAATVTFTATEETAYWVWLASDIYDWTPTSVSIKVTEITATDENDCSVTYYSIPTDNLPAATFPQTAEQVGSTNEIAALTEETTTPLERAEQATDISQEPGISPQKEEEDAGDDSEEVTA